MPELPEVETIRRGLAPLVEGATIRAVTLHRPDLRFPFPGGLSERLVDHRIDSAGRRAKYLLFTLSDGARLLSHLGMTGAWRFAGLALETPSRYRQPQPGRHDHLEIALEHPDHGERLLIYSDPRRFGFIGLIEPDASSPYLEGLGPEPLGNALNAAHLATRFAGRKAPVKSLLLDQRIVAGLGNIYVCEALWRAGIAPTTPGAALVQADRQPTPRLEALTLAIRAVLEAALAAGGSTLQDFRNAEGGTGYFQHSFDVYDREAEPCRKPGCPGTVARIVQSGRSSFYCPACQT